MQRALGYWESKRGGRLMPRRSDLDPAEIRELLPNLLLIDVLHEPRDFRYRLIGTGIVSRLARDYTGHCFSEFPQQREGSCIWQSYVRTVSDRRPHYSDIPYVGPDRYVRQFQDLQMPLSEDGETVNMVFTYAAFERIVG